MTVVTSVEKPEPVSGSPETHSPVGGAKASNIWLYRESKCTVAATPFEKTVLRTQSSSILFGKPNQTSTRECSKTEKPSDTSQGQVTEQSSVKSIVREAILKFSEGGKNESQAKTAPKNVRKVAENHPLFPKLTRKSDPQPLKIGVTAGSEKEDPPPPKNEENLRNSAKGGKQGGAMPQPVIIPAKLETKPHKPKAPADPDPQPNQLPNLPPDQTVPPENQHSSKTRRDAFKIMLERRKRNLNQDSISPKTKAKTKTTNIGHKTKQKPNQGLEKEKKPNLVSNTTNQNQTAGKLKVDLKPPKLFHLKKPPVTSNSVEPPVETSTSETKGTKPTQETKPIATKPPVEVNKTKPNTLQEMMQKAMPETKPKPASTPRRQEKPKPKPKPSVVETNELKLFLEKKKREREIKRTSVVVENIVVPPNQNLSPENHGVRATLSQTNTSPTQISPTQSAPRASRLRAQRLPDFSTSNQGDKKASASNEG